jgi:mycobactin lysine-N-oxygenase
MELPSQRLAVIGAGPKAAAIAAKAACLRDSANIPIEVVVFEKSEVGAAWTGRHGYTNGTQRLCTPAERDLGFPYDSDLAEGLNPILQNRYSWMAFAIATAKYGEWVDRGRRRPSHLEFASYLSWCLNDSAEIIYAEVTGLSHRAGRWTVVVNNAGVAERHTGFDGVVITGPGPQSNRLKKCVDPRVFDGVELWLPGTMDRVVNAAENAEEPVVIIGSGGTAAATAAALIQAGIKNEIIVLGSQAALYARADSYFENRTFRDPKFWSALSLDDRRTFSDRLTRGAVWSSVVDVLTEVDTVDYLQGSANQVRQDVAGDPASELLVDHVASANPTIINSKSASVVIDATGFDPLWFRSLFSKTLATQLKNEKKLRAEIDLDLRLRLPGVPRCTRLCWARPWGLHSIP